MHPPCALLWRILIWRFRKQVSLKVRHIPGQLNVEADKLSRLGQHFRSPFLDPLAWAVDALSLPWKDLDPYALTPIAILGKEVVKLRYYSYRRIVLICPGWLNNALVRGPSGHVRTNPNVLAQSANSAFLSDSTQESVNLNLHAWLPEPHLSKSKAPLRQWQHELRLLREVQPDQSMKQSEPFCKKVPLYSSGLQDTTYHFNGQLPPVFVPEQEVTAKYYRQLQISHCRQTGEFSH